LFIKTQQVITERSAFLAVSHAPNIQFERKTFMKKLTYVLAALATIAVAAPTLASAEEMGIRVGGDRDHGDRDRGEMHRDRDHDRGGMRVEMRGDRHHDRDWRNRRAESVVVIKHRRHHHDD
jgi:Ni/Co efflux regulator RcnB